MRCHHSQGVKKRHYAQAQDHRIPKGRRTAFRDAIAVRLLSSMTAMHIPKCANMQYPSGLRLEKLHGKVIASFPGIHLSFPLFFFFFFFFCPLLLVYLLNGS